MIGEYRTREDLRWLNAGFSTRLSQLGQIANLSPIVVSGIRRDLEQRCAYPSNKQGMQSLPFGFVIPDRLDREHEHATAI